jgi:predicted TIM-barrel fold metal-dependent hydrolase
MTSQEEFGVVSGDGAQRTEQRGSPGEVHQDVHQHLWSAAFVEALRERREPPFLDGWTLHLAGEPPYDLRPSDHDVARRVELARADGLGRVLVSLSTPIGVEWLPPEQATPLLRAYHDDAAALPEPFGAWAAACVREIDVAAAAAELDRGFAGLQLPATALADAAGFARCAPLLDLLRERDLPLLIHPGPAPGDTAAPGWWPALVPYVQQMHAAWFAFRAFGRPRHPGLRVCFTLLAGLAPLHGERLAARGGGRGEVDPLAFVETSSYGSRAVDSVVRAIGVDVIVYGSDRPYAGPPERPDFNLGEAGGRALRVANPHRLLSGRE